MRRMGHNLPADVTYVDNDGNAATSSKATLGDIFAPAYLRDTLALCASFFFCLMVNYIGILLIPVVFTQSGFERPAANRVLELFNYGGVAGAIIGAFFIKRMGSRVAMLGMSVMAVVVGLALARMTVSAPASFMLMTLMILGGALLNGVQTTMYALAAHVYPTAIRATGVGTAVGFGRIGGVLSPSVGQWALDSGGASGYFRIIAVTMSVAFVALAAVKRHIPRVSAVTAARPVAAAQRAN